MWCGISVGQLGSALLINDVLRHTEVDREPKNTLICVRFSPQEEVELFLNPFFGKPGKEAEPGDGESDKKRGEVGRNSTIAWLWTGLKALKSNTWE